MTKIIVKICTERTEYEQGVRNIRNAGFYMTGKAGNHEFWNSNKHEITYEVVKEF